MLCIASFPAVVSPSIHLRSASVHGRIYHISDITALVDTNYALYECDALGFICRQIFRSGDYSPGDKGRAKLAYDASTNTLAVYVAERGVIYAYHPTGV